MTAAPERQRPDADPATDPDAGLDTAVEAEAPAPLVRMRPRSVAMLVLVSVFGVIAYGWPFLVHPDTTTQHSADAPWIFVVLLPLLALVLLAEISAGGLDAKAVAMLGMLAAVGAALRALGPGAVGLEPSFIVLVLGGRVFGRGFGFVLGCLSLFAGALLTGGVGPWLPFQMLGAGWVGLGAGMLPARLRGFREVGMLAGYGVLAGLFYGALLNLWFWPFGTYGSALSYVPDASVVTNLHHYAVFWATTSLGWDIPRGALTALAVLLAGRPVLAALRRTARRAHFT